MLLKLNERLEIIAPTDAQWAISENLKDKIEQYANAILCSPVLSEYVTKQSSTKLVAGILAHHPSWGYTLEVQAFKYKRDIVLTQIGQCLTDRHFDIKEIRKTMVAVLQSPGSNFDKYWYVVDAQLASLQAKYSSDPAAISRIIKKSLEEDLQQLDVWTFPKLSMLTGRKKLQTVPQAVPSTC
ncbi:hypothetical protein BD414DRAFT_539625 [Trametes punicea]|nr:hypothetical protein BD414DRAFT_539625 [Trametes punicea]